jgi:hypothetical protein
MKIYGLRHRFPWYSRTERISGAICRTSPKICQAEGTGIKKLSFRAHPPPPPTTESRPGFQTNQINLPPSGGNSVGAKEIDQA